MTARKLPEIKACPRPGCKHRPAVYGGGYRYVVCPCGWYGPKGETDEAAILAWNRRAPDADAERRGAMKAVKWLRDFWTVQSGDELRAAIDRGEVLLAKSKKG